MSPTWGCVFVGWDCCRDDDDDRREWKGVGGGGGGGRKGERLRERVGEKTRREADTERLRRRGARV